MYVSMHVLVAIILEINARGILGRLTTGPKSTEATVGTTIKLDCATDFVDDEDAVEWRYKRDESTVFQIVYTNGHMVNGFFERFSVKRKFGRIYTLVITNINLKDAGIYICADVSGDRSSAELIVFDYYPSNETCKQHVPPDGVIGTNSLGIEPDNIRISCQLSYKGNIIPFMEWSQSGGDAIAEGVKTSEEDSNLISTLTIRADRLLKNNFTCQVKYNHPVLMSAYSWTTTVPTLSLSNATNVVSLGCDEKIVNCSKGIRYNCTYAWMRDAFVYSSDPALFLTDKPNGIYSCVSKCRIRGKRYALLNMNIELLCHKGFEFKIPTIIVLSLTVSLFMILGLTVYFKKDYIKNRLLLHERSNHFDEETELLLKEKTNKRLSFHTPIYPITYPATEMQLNETHTRNVRYPFRYPTFEMFERDIPSRIRQLLNKSTVISDEEKDLNKVQSKEPLSEDLAKHSRCSLLNTEEKSFRNSVCYFTKFWAAHIDQFGKMSHYISNI